jgi:hypothetical protein
MHGDGRRRPWMALVALGLILLAGNAIGYLAYNAGVAHGVAISASGAGADIERGAQVAVHRGYYGYGWHPFGFFGPLLFVFFWIFVARMLFWRRWGRHGYWRHGYGYYGPGCGPRGFRGPDRRDRYGRYDPDDDRPRDML